MLREFPIGRIDVRTFRIPTDRPESDGTFEWGATTLVTVHAEAGGTRGFGDSYTAAAAAQLIRELLAHRIVGMSALDVAAAYDAMVNAVRNVGESALSMTAVAAVDAAL